MPDPPAARPGPGCWLKTGAGKTYAAKGKTVCLAVGG
jgi:hypothetical protein